MAREGKVKELRRRTDAPKALKFERENIGRL
jgi:hypothetical protein